MVTAHWQGDAHRVQRYAYKSVDSSGVQFLPPTNALINKWKKGMQVGRCGTASCQPLRLLGGLGFYPAHDQSDYSCCYVV